MLESFYLRDIVTICCTKTQQYTLYPSSTNVVIFFFLYRNHWKSRMTQMKRIYKAYVVSFEKKPMYMYIYLSFCIEDQPSRMKIRKCSPLGCVQNNNPTIQTVLNVVFHKLCNKTRKKKSHASRCFHCFEKCFIVSSFKILGLHLKTPRISF